MVYGVGTVVGDQSEIMDGDQLIDRAGSGMIGRIERIEQALHFLVGASADAECAHPGLHELIRHIHRDARELRQAQERGIGVADSDPRDP